MSDSHYRCKNAHVEHPLTASSEQDRQVSSTLHCAYILVRQSDDHTVVSSHHVDPFPSASLRLELLVHCSRAVTSLFEADTCRPV